MCCLPHCLENCAHVVGCLAMLGPYMRLPVGIHVLAVGSCSPGRMPLPLWLVIFLDGLNGYPCITLRKCRVSFLPASRSWYGNGINITFISCAVNILMVRTCQAE